MLCVARQARTAYANGPAQNRRCVAKQELCCTYTTAIASWLDVHATNLLVGDATTTMADSSYLGVDTNRGTPWWYTASNPASTYPVFATANNVKCVQFDGVDDVLISYFSAQTTGPAATLVVMYQNFSPANDRVIVEAGTDYNFQTGSYIMQGGQTGAFAGLRGNVGYSTRGWSSPQTNWTVTASVMNKAAGLGSEELVYENGTQITVFTSATDSDNTNNFGQNTMRAGRRSTGALPMNGRIAAILIVSNALSLADVQNVTKLLRWRAGLSA